VHPNTISLKVPLTDPAGVVVHVPVLLVGRKKLDVEGVETQPAAFQRSTVAAPDWRATRVLGKALVLAAMMAMVEKNENCILMAGIDWEFIGKIGVVSAVDGAVRVIRDIEGCR